MGVRQPKNLADLPEFDANLKIICRNCGRSAVYPAQQMIDYFRWKRWNMSWEMIAYHFRCDNQLKREGCGARDARIALSPVWRPTPVPMPVPTELELRQEARRRR